ncbi:MAG TPA: hypothetical protein VGX96_09310 [Candidatus Elarobacter sp.]|jgi:hypothetical protein|nr:hypothetical protein [Candidatus Elarobacter sp.]
METLVSMVAFFALIVSWFVLPASPPQAKRTAPQPIPEAIATAA